MSLVILINKAVEIEFSSIFCFECSDNVYDQDFEKLKKLETVQILSLVSHIKDPNCKRIKVNGWYPSSYDVDTIKKKSKMIPTNGLRGLRNLGSTCFLSVVLQCFLHNPLLQLHFLSDRHNSNLCPLKICMACEMDKMFASCYNGGKTPIAPTSFLYSIWLSQSHLAGYSEKDAHEFFISLLDAVHANCSGNVQVNCECIVHKVFAGLMQSTVTCHLCGNVTTTEDPILDISLDIKSTSGKIPEKTNLAECLEKFTNFEKIGNTFKCIPCGGSQEASKQLSIKSLPPVLSIQLKRFEHTTQSTTKIETLVEIPLILDMSPYTSQNVKKRLIPPSRINKRNNSDEKRRVSEKLQPFDNTTDSIPNNIYHLTSVITHTGKIETGHYTCFVFHRGEWFLFDDHTITIASEKRVMAGNHYMLFYAKSNIGFSAVDAYEHARVINDL